jgi:hypothetical protein
MMRRKELLKLSVYVMAGAILPLALVYSCQMVMVFTESISMQELQTFLFFLMAICGMSAGGILYLMRLAKDTEEGDD